MLISLFQPIGLDGQNLLTAAAALDLIPRHKRLRSKFPVQNRLFRFQAKRNFDILRLRFLSESAHAPSVGKDPLHIDIAVNRLTAEFLYLGQQNAVFSDQVMPAEHQILSRFPLSGRCVDVAADQPGAGGFHQQLPVFVLSHRLVGCRQVRQDSRTLQGVVRSRRVRYPQVFTDFTSYRQSMYVLTGKQKIGAKGDCLSMKYEKNRFRIALGKMPSFIEFRIRRNIGFGNHPQNLAPAEHRRHIVQPAVPFHRQPYHNQRIFIPGALRNLQQLAGCFLQQQRLQE